MNDRRNPIGEWSVALAIVVLVGIGTLAAMLIASASSDSLLATTADETSLDSDVAPTLLTPQISTRISDTLVVLPSPPATLVVVATFMSEAADQIGAQASPINERTLLSATPTALASATSTVPASASPTTSLTPVPLTLTSTRIASASATATRTPTLTSTATATVTPSATPTPSPTSSATPTPSPTQTLTPSPTFTSTPTPTATPTMTPSLTNTWTPMPTPGPIGCESKDVIITSPFPGLRIAQPFAIVGSANPSDFAGYALDIRAEGSSSYHPLARGRTRVVGGLLANADPRRFGQGLFWLRLSVTSTAGNVPLEYICEIPVHFE